MATEPTTYPKITRKSWWLLRDRFKKSIPSAVTTTLISSLSPMADASARSNVIAPLKELGLLDDAGKPSPLAERWRHDDDYPKVCQEIRSRIYPRELLEAFPDPDSSRREAIKAWFMKVGHVGESAARMYTDTFLLLSEADPTKTETKQSTPTANGTTAAKARLSKQSNRAPTPKAAQAAAPVTAPPPPPAPDPSHGRKLPAIHIDVQVHIAPDTPADQIDRIFESMAKHLGAFVK